MSKTTQTHRTISTSNQEFFQCSKLPCEKAGSRAASSRRPPSTAAAATAATTGSLTASSDTTPRPQYSRVLSEPIPYPLESRTTMAAVHRVLVVAVEELRAAGCSWWQGARRAREAANPRAQRGSAAVGLGRDVVVWQRVLAALACAAAR